MAEKGHEKGENSICQLAVMLHASYQTDVRGGSISKSSPAKFAANMTTPRLAGDWGSFFSGESNQERSPCKESSEMSKSKLRLCDARHQWGPGRLDGSQQGINE